MISPNVRKWVFMGAIAVNTALFPVSLFFLNSTEMAAVNFMSGLLCWWGYFLAIRDIDNKEQ